MGQMEYERITESYKAWCVDGQTVRVQKKGYDYIDIVMRLAELEDIIESGLSFTEEILEELTPLIRVEEPIKPLRGRKRKIRQK